MSESRVTKADLEKFEQATAEAFALVVGLLGEAAGSQKLAYHMGASMHAAETQKPNPIRDRLLDPAFRMLLLKAMRADPDDPVLQDLQTTYQARRTKH